MYVRAVLQYLVGDPVLGVYLLPFLDHGQSGLASRSRHVPGLSTKNDGKGGRTAVCTGVMVRSIMSTKQKTVAWPHTAYLSLGTTDQHYCTYAEVFMA